jgi:hypothetical protein
MATELSIGQEVMRVDFGSPEVKELKNKFASLFDELALRAQKMQEEIDTPPSIHSDETIKRHMDLIKNNEDGMRCLAEASKILEMACMYAVKGITSGR